MFTSVNEKVFDIVLNELNANTQGARFEGNFTFKFWTQPSAKIQEFHIIKTNETLEYEAEEVAPFVDVNFIEIPFNEQNKRSDMELEYYVAVRIDEERSERGRADIKFNKENKYYQAIMETIENMRSQLTYTGEGYKVTFKVKEPQKVNIFKFNSNYYQLFALTFTASKIEVGRFGNDFKLYFGQVGGTLTQLDTVETTLIMSKIEHDKTATTEKDKKTTVQYRSFEVRATINFNERDVDKLLLNEVVIAGLAENDNRVNYDVRLYQEGSFDITRSMKVMGGNMTFQNNVVETITFNLKP